MVVVVMLMDRQGGCRQPRLQLRALLALALANNRRPPRQLLLLPLPPQTPQPPSHMGPPGDPPACGLIDNMYPYLTSSPIGTPGDSPACGLLVIIYTPT